MDFSCQWNGEDQFEMDSSFGEKLKVHLHKMAVVRDSMCTRNNWDFPSITQARNLCQSMLSQKNIFAGL